MTVPVGSLTTLANVKDELSISSLDTSKDSYLERLIGSATAYASQFCSRTFHYATGIVEDVGAFGTPFIHVSRAPIVSIASITYGFPGQLVRSTISTSNYEIYNANAGQIYAPYVFVWTALGGSGITHLPKVDYERKLYEVTYTGGYVTPQQEADSIANHDNPALVRNLPYDLEDAVIMLVMWRYRNRGRDMSIITESLLESSVSFKGISSEHGLKAKLPMVYETLVQYKWEPML